MMPTMPRPKGLATDIAYSILGTPPNMPYKKYEIAMRHVKSGSQEMSPKVINTPYTNGYDDKKETVTHGMMGGGYL